MALDPVLLRSQVIGADGLMTREWARQQTQLQSVATEVTTTVVTNITNLQVGSTFDDVCVRDFQPAIWDAYLLDQAPSPQVYDDRDLRALLAAQAPSPQVYDDRDVRALLAAPQETPNHLGIQQQIDELRAQWASADPPLPLGNGVTGTVTLAKLTTANGSLTLVNGLITAFTNPT